MTQFYRLLPSPRPELAHSGGVLPPLSAESDTARAEAPEANVPEGKAKSSEDVDLNELMAKLKALAAKAQQSPPPSSGRHLAIAAAITLSISSGAATAQYVVPGHSRAPAAPGKSVAATPIPGAVPATIHH